MGSRDVLRKIFESILTAYIQAYPEKPELKRFEKKIDDYVRRSEFVGGGVVRIFVEDLRRIAGGGKEVYVDTTNVSSELKRLMGNLEIRRRDLASKIISKLNPLDEVARAGVDAHKIVAEILADPEESYECPACFMNKRKSRLLRKRSFHFCPVCFALYVEKNGKIQFVHRLSVMDIELALDILGRNVSYSLPSF